MPYTRTSKQKKQDSKLSDKLLNAYIAESGRGYQCIPSNCNQLMTILRAKDQQFKAERSKLNIKVNPNDSSNTLLNARQNLINVGMNPESFQLPSYTSDKIRNLVYGNNPVGQLRARIEEDKQRFKQKERRKRQLNRKPQPISKKAINQMFLKVIEQNHIYINPMNWHVTISEKQKWIKKIQNERKIQVISLNNSTNIEQNDAVKQMRKIDNQILKFIQSRNLNQLSLKLQDNQINHKNRNYCFIETVKTMLIFMKIQQNKQNTVSNKHIIDEWINIYRNQMRITIDHQQQLSLKAFRQLKLIEPTLETFVFLKAKTWYEILLLIMMGDQKSQRLYQRLGCESSQTSLEDALRLLYQRHSNEQQNPYLDEKSVNDQKQIINNICQHIMFILGHKNEGCSDYLKLNDKERSLVDLLNLRNQLTDNENIEELKRIHINQISSKYKYLNQFYNDYKIYKTPQDQQRFFRLFKDILNKWAFDQIYQFLVENQLISQIQQCFFCITMRQYSSLGMFSSISLNIWSQKIFNILFKIIQNTKDANLQQNTNTFNLIAPFCINDDQISLEHSRKAICEQFSEILSINSQFFKNYFTNRALFKEIINNLKLPMQIIGQSLLKYLKNNRGQHQQLTQQLLNRNIPIQFFGEQKRSMKISQRFSNLQINFDYQASPEVLSNMVQSDKKECRLFYECQLYTFKLGLKTMNHHLIQIFSRIQKSQGNNLERLFQYQKLVPKVQALINNHFASRIKSQQAKQNTQNDICPNFKKDQLQINRILQFSKLILFNIKIMTSLLKSQKNEANSATAAICKMFEKEIKQKKALVYERIEVLFQQDRTFSYDYLISTRSLLLRIIGLLISVCTRNNSRKISSLQTIYDKEEVFQIIEYLILILRNKCLPYDKELQFVENQYQRVMN